jgi:palmitoyltransferase ZDHHC9/14/18
MTGGSDWYSAILALVFLLGMTGLWIGTTGVWMWRYGSEYGLAKGGGVAVTIIFV